MFGELMKEAQQELAETDYSWDQLTDLIDQKIKAVLAEPWTVGFKDRGLGHGDYAVITKASERLIVETSCRELAEHIVQIHNVHIGGNDGNPKSDGSL